MCLKQIPIYTSFNKLKEYPIIDNWHLVLCFYRGCLQDKGLADLLNAGHMIWGRLSAWHLFHVKTVGEDTFSTCYATCEKHFDLHSIYWSNESNEDAVILFFDNCYLQYIERVI